MTSSRATRMTGGWVTAKPRAGARKGAVQGVARTTAKTPYTKEAA